ncbi:TetR/AcrR family transcriptional regulator [Alteriqipengyuania lutimaris]|uniref:TetR/AcrR family transcriptional regulator n=1 Tax=Alteriqipengyuania lutimaris TaxID=1538146 RepID=A0A395LLT5_9SPHN|nr:TetR/AcrR family transcriptional regulator [Alteriqipengyuania lutimaris]MBB3033117.1 AcrR family transcriptional regulator [Alteriqipengyuania lutimaris]RDS77821.1 TetR/AcrR family transcriptional regulator [Alteriqipengyuania lutimaris]
MAQIEPQTSPAPPATERGRRTRRKLLDAATSEFGERGFHEASIASITRRAGVALGSFYTYFESKEAIFRDLVRDLSDGVRRAASERLAERDLDALETERAALSAFMAFAREHKEIYRIIDEAEFVDPQSYRTHYEKTAERILGRLREGASENQLRDDIEEAHAWAIMGMNVFLGLRYAVWNENDDAADGSTRAADRAVQIANSILAEGIGPKG